MAQATIRRVKLRPQICSHLPPPISQIGLWRREGLISNTPPLNKHTATRAPTTSTTTPLRNVGITFTSRFTTTSLTLFHFRYVVRASPIAVRQARAALRVYNGIQGQSQPARGKRRGNLGHRHHQQKVTRQSATNVKCPHCTPYN